MMLLLLLVLLLLMLLLVGCRLHRRWLGLAVADGHDRLAMDAELVSAVLLQQLLLHLSEAHRRGPVALFRLGHDRPRGLEDALRLALEHFTNPVRSLGPPGAMPLV